MAGARTVALAIPKRLGALVLALLSIGAVAGCGTGNQGVPHYVAGTDSWPDDAPINFTSSLTALALSADPGDLGVAFLERIRVRRDVTILDARIRRRSNVTEYPFRYAVINGDSQPRPCCQVTGFSAVCLQPPYRVESFGASAPVNGQSFSARDEIGLYGMFAKKSASTTPVVQGVRVLIETNGKQAWYESSTTVIEWNDGPSGCSARLPLDWSQKDESSFPPREDSPLVHLEPVK